MNCAEATATVQAYIDGELHGVDRESVERHLVSCPGCSSRVHVQTRFRAAVRAHPVSYTHLTLPTTERV